MNEKDMMLGEDWFGCDPSGWLMSEKLDGCHAYWDGVQFWTRGGKIIKAPKSITETMPKGVHVSGEMWAGRGGFENARVAVQFGKFTSQTKFVAFDFPKASGNHAQRMVNNYGLETVSIKTCQDTNHLRIELSRVHSIGGEGLMIQHPENQYQAGRTTKLLKVKGAYQFEQDCFSTR